MSRSGAFDSFEQCATPLIPCEKCGNLGAIDQGLCFHCRSSELIFQYNVEISKKQNELFKYQQQIFNEIIQEQQRVNQESKKKSAILEKAAIEISKPLPKPTSRPSSKPKNDIDLAKINGSPKNVTSLDASIGRACCYCRQNLIPKENVISLICGHYMHQRCLLEVLKKSSVCPFPDCHQSLLK